MLLLDDVMCEDGKEEENAEQRETTLNRHDASATASMGFAKGTSLP